MIKLILNIVLFSLLTSCKNERSGNYRKENSHNNHVINVSSDHKDSLYVISIIDGDTYDVLTNDKQTIRIRMNGIDAPEKGMPFHKVSKQFLADLIFNKYVKIEVLKKDRNGRSIAKTFIGNVDVSAEMIKVGLAWHFKKFSEDRKYVLFEEQAKAASLRIWQEKDPIPPWEIRKLRRQGISTKGLYTK